MDRQLLLQKFMREELNRYEALQGKFNDIIPLLPKGAIIERGEGNYSIKGRDGGKQFMIALDPSDQEIYKQLKMRRYISEELPLLKNQIKLCREFLLNSQVIDPCRIEKTLQNQYHDLSGLDIFLENDFDPESWKSEPYVRNPYYPEKLIHNTEGGLKTRSKSEAMIGTQLEKSEFFFRCEEQLKLGDKFVYPDFTILQHYIRRVVYWEHLGMVENPGYMMSNLQKLEEYAEHGILLGYNLIITYETREQPLTIKKIDDTIKIIRNMSLPHHSEPRCR